MGKVGTGLTLTKAAAPQTYKITDFSWSGYGIELLDASHMESEDFKDKVAGLLADPGEMQFTCLLEDAAPPLIDSTFAAWSVTFNGAKVLAGNATVTAVGISAAVEQLQTFTLTLGFEGAITIT